MVIRTTYTILADETVSVSELKKSPSQYFTDHAIAVLSNNRPTGYVIGAEAYEALVSLLSQCQQSETFPGTFRPTADRVREITAKGMKLLQNISSDDLEKLGQYSK
jgi:antitoxin YafN